MKFRVKMVQTNSNNREKYRTGESDIEMRLKVLENEIVEKKKKLRSDGDLLMNIKKGICSLGSKLCWIDVPDLREEQTVSDIIINITTRYPILLLIVATTLNLSTIFQYVLRTHRLDKLQEIDGEQASIINQKEMRQEFCLSKLLAKSLVPRFSDEAQSSEMAGTFEDVLEINDNTPMVRNYMKTASRRLVQRQKKKK